MSDLIGRFLSFEEHLGRGLVKFAYYVALFYLVVISLYQMVVFLVAGFHLGQFLLVPFRFLIQLLVLRVLAEVVLAILSIDDHLQGAAAAARDDGFEAGLTPRADTRPRPAPETTVTDVPATDPPDEDEDDTRPA